MIGVCIFIILDTIITLHVDLGLVDMINILLLHVPNNAYKTTYYDIKGLKCDSYLKLKVIIRNILINFSKVCICYRLRINARSIITLIITMVVLSWNFYISLNSSNYVNFQCLSLPFLFVTCCFRITIMNMYKNRLCIEQHIEKQSLILSTKWHFLYHTTNFLLPISLQVCTKPKNTT